MTDEQTDGMMDRSGSKIQLRFFYWLSATPIPCHAKTNEIKVCRWWTNIEKKLNTKLCILFCFESRKLDLFFSSEAVFIIHFDRPSVGPVISFEPKAYCIFMYLLRFLFDFFVSDVVFSYKKILLSCFGFYIENMVTNGKIYYGKNFFCYISANFFV